MRNIKQKDNRMDLNKLHCFYSDHVTSNQKTQIDKTCWRDLASLPYHIVYKDLSKLTIYVCEFFSPN